MVRLYQQHYSNMKSKAPFNKEFTPTNILEEMFLLKWHACSETLNDVCGKREI